jgi:flagellar hook-associated protein 2
VTVEPVRIGGFFSTFDYETVLQQLQAVKLAPVQRLEVEIARAEVRGQLLANINAQMANLLGKAKILTTSTSVLGKTATAAGDFVTASALAGASVGSFTMDVLKLATATKVGGVAISNGLDSASPMNRANFANTPTNGRFTIATTGGGSAVINVGSTVIDNVAVLDAANFATAVTSGTFTIATATGGSAIITIDAATQSLDDVIGQINGSGIGITATITNDANGRANTLTLTSAQGDITLGDTADSSNFLTATNLKDVVSGTTMSSKSGMAVQQSLTEVIADINAAGVGITATVVNDANGRPNLINLSSASGDISLGNATDTSNFLVATNLLASPGTTTRQSTLSIARLSQGDKMIDADWFGGAPVAGDQQLVINGVTIDYNTASDSLGEIVSRINASGAGVVARYDSATDNVRLEQSVTGSMAIAMTDVGGGDLLAKLGLSGATQTMGTNAEYSVNGGPTQYSSSNQVSPTAGVTVTLKKVTEPGSPETVTVSQDADGAVKSIKALVDQYNAVLNAIDEATKVDPENLGNSGELSGDNSLRQLRAQLRTIISGIGVNVAGTYQNLNEIGIGFGAFGSAVGSTNQLQLDEAKFKSALAADPQSVQNLLSVFTLTASLQAGGTGSITGITGNYSGTAQGTYVLTDFGDGTLVVDFTPTDGSQPTQTTMNIAAGGSNSTAIPGITLQFAGILQAGSHTITVTNTAASPLARVRELLAIQTAPGGVLDQRQATYDEVKADYQDRIQSIQQSVDKEIEILRRKFVLMEQAQARANSMLSALQQMQQQLTALLPGNRNRN